MIVYYDSKSSISAIMKSTARRIDPSTASVCEYPLMAFSDRAGIREAFRAAIEAGGDNTDPETVVAFHFSNSAPSAKNTDEVMPDDHRRVRSPDAAFFEKNSLPPRV